MYYLLYSLVVVMSYIPFKVLYALSDLLYYPLYYVIRYRRGIVRSNLTSSFPNKDISEIVAIEKKFYHYFVDMMLESCKLATISPEEIRRRMKFVNYEILNDSLHRGQSVTAFLGHYGNWEWMTSVGLWLDEGFTCAQVYHKLVNSAMDDVMEKLRTRTGNECVEMRKTGRFVASMESEGKSCLLALVADHSPKRRDIRHYLQFLNHNVPVIVGPEKMTKHFGYLPVFVNVKRIKRGYYEVELSVLHNDPASLPDYELSNLYFQRLEEEITEHPELYLWTHNRFKYAMK